MHFLVNFHIQLCVVVFRERIDELQSLWEKLVEQSQRKGELSIALLRFYSLNDEPCMMMS